MGGRERQTLTGAQDPARLPEPRARLDEVVRRRRVELEHLEVARNGESRSRLVRDPRRVTAVHVPELAVDRQQGDVRCERQQPLAEPDVGRCVAGVVERPRAALDDEADGSSGDVVLRADSGETEALDGDSLVDIDDMGKDVCALDRERLQARWTDERAGPQRAQRERIEMVSVTVAGGDDIDEREPRGVDDASRHPHVRGRRTFVLLGQRVRQIRVEQEIAVVELDEEAALAEPPEMQRTRGRLLDVAQEGVVRERRLDQAPTSSRTMATPRTRFASF